jgi:hypothetical protein
MTMRKPRDYDAELKLLDDRAKALKARKLEQLGELVVATGADALPVEQLAGALLTAADRKDAAAMEAQRARGAAFFQAAQRSRRSAGGSAGGGAPDDGGASPAASSTGAP